MKLNKGFSLSKRILSAFIAFVMMFTVIPFTVNAVDKAEGPRMLGDVNGNTKIEISDALEILKYLAGLDSEIKYKNAAYDAALIISEEKPAIIDALEVLKALVGMNSLVTVTNADDCSPCGECDGCNDVCLSDTLHCNVCGCCGCYNYIPSDNLLLDEPQLEDNKFIATVLENHETSILVEAELNSWVRNSADKIWVSIKNASLFDTEGDEISSDKFMVGATVEISFTGGIAESYPAQINGCYEVALVFEPFSLIELPDVCGVGNFICGKCDICNPPVVATPTCNRRCGQVCSCVVTKEPKLEVNLPQKYNFEIQTVCVWNDYMPGVSPNPNPHFIVDFKPTANEAIPDMDVWAKISGVNGTIDVQLSCDGNYPEYSFVTYRAGYEQNLKLQSGEELDVEITIEIDGEKQTLTFNPIVEVTI